jgi:hypothetical protein
VPVLGVGARRRRSMRRSGARPGCAWTPACRPVLEGERKGSEFCRCSPFPPIALSFGHDLQKVALASYG